MKLILIGGVPRTGKTTLAKKLASDLHISWLSTDALEAIAHSYTPPELVAERFPKSVMRRKTNRSNDELYATYSIAKIIDAYEAQAETVASAIEALATYAHKEGWGYVIEGYHVTPSLLAKLREAGITFSSVVLVNTNPTDAIERSRQSEVKNDWIRDNTHNEETYEQIGAGITEHSERLMQQSKEHGMHWVDMATDFETKTVEVYRQLIE